MKRLDYPPVWLLLFMAGAWFLDRLLPLGFLGLTGRVLAVLLILAALLLTALAARQMQAARTTVLPHRQPTALVTDGVFRHSRNPIYLADAMILTGWALWLDAPLALLLVPGFMAVIHRRFIRPEEARLRAGFGAAFETWRLSTRRWL